MTFRELIEQRQDEILENNYKLYQDSDSGITWYEDNDLDNSYDKAVAEIESEINKELGIMSLVILENEKFYMQRIFNLDKFNKKNVAAILQNNKIVYSNGYFRFAVSN